MAEPVGVGVAAAQLDLQGPPKVTSGWSSSARRSKPPAPMASMARALDVVGERWSLLVVRELLQGPRRYGELLDGLPGIATNLLAERLRSLEDSGVITRSRDDRYALTPWGKELNDVVYALGRWAAPLMARPADTAELRSHWLSHMVVARFEGVDPKRGDLAVEIHVGDRPATLISSGGRVHLMAGTTSAPDITLTGPPDGVVGLIVGRICRRDAERARRCDKGRCARPCSAAAAFRCVIAAGNLSHGTTATVDW